MNRVSVNVVVQVSPRHADLESFRGIPRRGVAESHGRSDLVMRENVRLIAIASGWMNLHSHHPCVRVPHTSSSAVLVFLRVAILTGVMWNLRDGFICMPLIAKNGDHFFPLNF